MIKYINNPKKTILEIANKSDPFQNKVLAFGISDVFPFIPNEKRSGIPLNAGYRFSLAKKNFRKSYFLYEIQDEIPKPWGVAIRFDVFTHNYAM